MMAEKKRTRIKTQQKGQNQKEQKTKKPKPITTTKKVWDLT